MSTEVVEQVAEVEEVVEPKTFDEAYVNKLREENAEQRTKAKEASEKAQKAAERLAHLTIRDSVQDVLADPTDLLTLVPGADVYNEDGEVDPAKAQAVAEALVERKPYLAARKFGGDVGQGQRGTVEPPARSFHDMLMGLDV